MAEFTITGTAARISAQVTWRDGDVTGDELLIAEARSLERLGRVSIDPLTVGIPGVWSGRPGLDEHLQALATLAFLMDPGYVVDGDEPEVEALPEGDDVVA